MTFFSWLDCAHSKRKRSFHENIGERQTTFSGLKIHFSVYLYRKLWMFTSLSISSFDECFAKIDAQFLEWKPFYISYSVRSNSTYYRAWKYTWHVHVRLLLNEITSYHDALFRQLTSIFIPFSMKFSVKRLPKRRTFSEKRFRQGERKREIFVKTFFSNEIEKLIAWRNKCR